MAVALVFVSPLGTVFQFVAFVDEQRHVAAVVNDELRAEVERLSRRADDSAAHNLRAIELAAEAKGISEGKRVDSFPPLVRPLIVIVGKVGSHIAKDGLKHGLTIVGTLLAAYLAHHFGWLGWLLK